MKSSMVGNVCKKYHDMIELQGKHMIIDCIADLHGFYPKLEGGDLLIVAGDMTANDKIPQWVEFYDWINVQDYRKKVYIGGNHDNFLTHAVSSERPEYHWIKHIPELVDNDDKHGIYLCDSGTEFGGLKIWGSPWTKTFPGMNYKCKAFTVETEEELAKKWKVVPDDIDILITHSPAYGMGDMIWGKRCVGSKSLQMELFSRLRPKLMVVGHIHEGYGEQPPGGIVERYVNASHVNERYKPVNAPVRIIL